MLQVKTISPDTVKKLNGLIRIDQSFLSDNDKFSQICIKLKSKINVLKDSIAVSLPNQLSDLSQNDFSNFCAKINFLSEKLRLIRQKENQIRNSIDNFKMEIGIKNEKYLKNESLKQFILKFMNLSRHHDYFAILIILKSYNTEIAKQLRSFDEIKRKEQSFENSRKNQSINLDLESNVCTNKSEILKSLLKTYEQLKKLNKFSIETRCYNLKSFMIDSLGSIQEHLRKILKLELETVLQQLKYPQEKFDIKRKENPEIVKKVHDYVSYLLIIDIPILENENDNFQSSIIEILIKPFEKRYKFHFLTNRKTNDINKPEWYLSQIMQWIKEQNDFLSQFIQPIFNEIKFWNKKSALIMFVNKMIWLVKEKLDTDFRILFENSEQFLHTIDELLIFSDQLILYLNNKENSNLLSDHQYLYNCYNVICENQLIFSHWLRLEKQIWQKYLDDMFSNSSSIVLNFKIEKSSIYNPELNDFWSKNYSNFDTFKSTKCAECFILIIKSIKDRFYNLPYPSKKIRFVSLQIDLLKDFHLRLCQILRDEENNIFSKAYLGVLTTIDYVIKVLDEWKNSKFYKIKYEQFIEKNQLADKFGKDYFADSESEQKIDQEMSDFFDASIKSTKIFMDIEGTIFDDLLSSYEKVKNDIINNIVNNCKWEFTSRANMYKKEKWMCMPLVCEFYKQTLTDSASDMLISLRNILHLLKDSIPQDVFNTIIKKISAELDVFYYKDLILNNTFNEGGIDQLNYDINKYLMPILNEFTSDCNISSLFKLTNESISLIKMEKGSALLLKELLDNSSVKEKNREIFHLSDYDSKLKFYNVKNALKEMNIRYLTCEQSRKVLCLRYDLVK